MKKFLSFFAFTRDELETKSRVYVYDLWKQYNELRCRHHKKPILLSSTYRGFHFLEALSLVSKAEKESGKSRFRKQWYVKGENFASSDWNSPQHAYDLLFGNVVLDPTTGKMLSIHTLGRKYQELVLNTK